MKIHEYQAKAILREYGVAVPPSIPCFTVEEAMAAARQLNSAVYAVKAQIHAGGRGKGGGVKIARSVDDVHKYAREILGMRLVTHQTGPTGQIVRRLLIEAGVVVAKECYIGIVVDRQTQLPCIMASGEGGMDIETVASRTPEKIHKVAVDPHKGLLPEQAEFLAQNIALPEAAWPKTCVLLQCLYKAFWETDASLLEVNPLALLQSGEVMALDAKMTFDENALFRQPKIAELADLDEENALEVEAASHDLSYVSLDGNIACLVNGAGLAMATMDTVQLFGGKPANFLDVGGSADVEHIMASFRIMMKNPQVRIIFVNIFGGILRCDVVAQGLVDSIRALELKVPIIARLVGTNSDMAKQIIKKSGLAVTMTDTMAEAARLSVDMAARPAQ